MNRQAVETKLKEILTEQGVVVTNKQVKEIVNALFGCMVKNLQEGEEVVLPLLGKIKVVDTKERKGKIKTINGEIKEWTKPAGKKLKLVAKKGIV